MSDASIFDIVTSVFAGLGLGAIAFIAWQSRLIRRQGMHEMWNYVASQATNLMRELGRNSKVEDIPDEEQRRELRRSYHLYLDRLGEALVIEPKKEWFATWWPPIRSSKRHQRLIVWYYKTLELYVGDRSTQDVRLIHDPSKDPDDNQLAYEIIQRLGSNDLSLEEIIDGMRIDKDVMEQKLAYLREMGLVKKFWCEDRWELTDRMKRLV